MMPERIQRKRTKGWRMPYNAKYVGRPMIFGNPFLISSESDAQFCVDAYRRWIHRPSQARIVDLAKKMLKGKDMACWCPLGQPCHADVLLDIANAAPPLTPPQMREERPEFGEGRFAGCLFAWIRHD